MKKRIISLLTSLVMVISFVGVVPSVKVKAAYNPYPINGVNGSSGAYSNCTWSVWQLVYDNLGIALPSWGWAGEQWLTNARNSGYSTGTQPAVNSIIVYNNHVAFVTGVSGDKVYIKEGGYGTGSNLGYHEGYSNAYGSREYTGQKILGYIYLKGNGGNVNNPMATPTISFGSESYVVGDTMHISWEKTSSDSDFYQYWLIIDNLDTNKNIYAGDAGSTNNPNKNYYDIRLDTSGTHKIKVYAVPYNDKNNKQKYDEKYIDVYYLEKPTLSFDKSVYSVGDNINISWKKSNEKAIVFYWLIIKSPSGLVIYDNPTLNKDADFQFTPTESGNYTISVSSESITRQIRSKDTVQLNVSAHVHSYDSKITKQPTCMTTGEKTLTCSLCGETKTETIPTIAHKYTETIIAPTLKEQGYTLHKCSVCGDEYKDNYIKPLNETELKYQLAYLGGDKWAVRFLLVVDEEAVLKAEKASIYLTRNNGAKTKETPITTAYRSVRAGGKTVSAGKGKVYLTAMYTNIPVFEMYHLKATLNLDDNIYYRTIEEDLPIDGVFDFSDSTSQAVGIGEDADELD